MDSKVRTCLWFDANGEEAADPSNKQVMAVAFHLAGTSYEARNGGPELEPTEAVSLIVKTDDQSENDRQWAAVAANEGNGGKCGWLKDRCNVSCPIIPRALPNLLSRDWQHQRVYRPP
ncbi:MAG: VOC family protein [Pseudomonadota bacterium]